MRSIRVSCPAERKGQSRKKHKLRGTRKRKIKWDPQGTLGCARTVNSGYCCTLCDARYREREKSWTDLYRKKERKMSPSLFADSFFYLVHYPSMYMRQRTANAFLSSSSNLHKSYSLQVVPFDPPLCELQASLLKRDVSKVWPKLGTRFYLLQLQLCTSVLFRTFYVRQC